MEEQTTNDLENTVLTSLKERTTITNQIDPDQDTSTTTFGQRIADNVATFGGSWTFIICFGVFIIVWILINVILLTTRAYDPYPFILLNLILSCLAALQAPVIMMSQNRQEFKDRERSKKDYMINLKSELEIRILHEKLDHLMIHQQQNLIQFQNEQIKILDQIIEEIRKTNNSETKVS